MRGKPVSAVLLRGLAVALSVPTLAIALLLLLADTPFGREQLIRITTGLSDGAVKVSGLNGRFPDALRIERIELRNAGEVWLTITQLALDWSPLSLLTGAIDIERLAAQRIDWLDLPPTAYDRERRKATPLRWQLHRLHVEQLALAPAVAGQSAVLTLTGSAAFASPAQADLDLTMRRADGDANYAVNARIAAGALRARLSVNEAGGGLLATLAGLPTPGALSISAELHGALDAIDTRLTLNAGPLKAKTTGRIDMTLSQAQLAIDADAPAMQLTPDLSWQAMTLNAKLQGAWDKPGVNGELAVTALKTAGLSAGSVRLTARSDLNRATLNGQLTGLTVPGVNPDALRGTTMRLDASTRLDAADYPSDIRVQHPLLGADGHIRFANGPEGALHVTLPDLQPITAWAGDSGFTLRIAGRPNGAELTLDGRAALGMAGRAWPGETRFGASAVIHGRDLKLNDAHLDGQTLQVAATGQYADHRGRLDWRVKLTDCSALSDSIAGQVSAQGQAMGTLQKFDADAELQGEIAANHQPRQTVSAKLRLHDLPHALQGHMALHTQLDDSPLELALSGQQTAGGLRLAIDRAAWKSAHATGALLWAERARLPTGAIAIDAARLENFQTWLGPEWAGALTATLQTKTNSALLNVAGRRLHLPGAVAVEQANLALTIDQPLRPAALTGRLLLDELDVAGWQGGASLDLSGPPAALAIKLASDLTTPRGAALRTTAAGVANVPARMLTLSQLSADGRGENLRLQEPARVDFADGVKLGRVRLGVRNGIVTLAGRLSPSLDIELDAQQVPADLISLWLPDAALDGALHATATLRGSYRRPQGRVTVAAERLRMRNGPWRNMPPLSATARAELNGDAAIAAKLDAGPVAQLAIAGVAPLSADAAFKLHGQGALDLKLLDAWLTPDGRRLRGVVTLSADLTGTPAAPQLSGSVRLSNGEFIDYPWGARISGLTGALQTAGGRQTLRLVGRAGPGQIVVDGSVDAWSEGVPVDLHVKASAARPWSGDRLAVSLDSDISLRGQALVALKAAGAIRVRRAELRIPERLPAGIAVLAIRNPKTVAARSTQQRTTVALDLNIDAPREIFVRGRGIDAELGGSIRLQGTALQPQPSGGFALRRGQYSLAGKTLTFNRGWIGFEGGSVFEPTLDFAASTASDNVVAELTVSGSVADPKITLSSEPGMPQDEVLAYLLFNRASASLGPLEMVQIASVLATLTGVKSDQPLDIVRQKLGMDRLTLGGATSPTLEAGRYLAPGVYVGVKQGASDGQTQATVQIDVSKHFKVEGAVGAGASSGTVPTAGGSSIGVLYQIEY